MINIQQFGSMYFIYACSNLRIDIRDISTDLYIEAWL